MTTDMNFLAGIPDVWLFATAIAWVFVWYVFSENRKQGKFNPIRVCFVLMCMTCAWYLPFVLLALVKWFGWV